MPEDIDFDAAAATLRIGAGRVSGVTSAMWEYETSGYKIVRRWFAKRKRHPDGKRSSPLDDIVARKWSPDWTRELIDLLNVLALLVELEPDQGALLEQIATGPLIAVDDLTASAVLPVKNRPAAEKPPKQAQL